MHKNDPLVELMNAAPEDEPTPVTYNADEANYFLHVVDFNRSTIKDLVDRTSPLDMVVMMAFLQAAIESQIPEAAGAFDEQREFFGSIYPAFVKGHVLQHPEEAPAEGELLILVPAPAEALGVCNAVDPPRIISPGSSRIN